MNLNYTFTAHNLVKSDAMPVVFIIDSDASVRETFCALIRSAGWQPRSASSVEEFLAYPQVTTPGCLLLELDLAGLIGVDRLRLVLDRREMPIVFIGGRDDLRTTVQVMKAAAFEFLIKPMTSDVALEAIRAALARSVAVLRHFAQVRFLQERYESLSRREREVMMLLVCGCLNKQVGGELGISEITVKAHRGKMMRKMQAASFAELVRMAVSLRGNKNPDAMEFDAPIQLPRSERYHRAIASY